MIYILVGVLLLLAVVAGVEFSSLTPGGPASDWNYLVQLVTFFTLSP